MTWGAPCGRLVVGEGDVLNLARFRNGVRVLGGVLLEEVLELGVAGIDLLLQVVRVEHRVVELDLGRLSR